MIHANQSINNVKENKLFKKLLTYIAFRNKKYVGLYRRFARPSGEEYAKLIKHHRFFFAMGDNCFIVPDSYLGGAKHIKLGNNVLLASCNLFTHDGVVSVLNKAYGMKLDAVGFIVIGNNVFIGHLAKVMRNVTIGDNCIIAAGSIVTKDVPSNSIVAGIPAKIIGQTDKLAQKMLEESKSLPWYHLIEKRNGSFDPNMEEELTQLRNNYFFGND